MYNIEACFAEILKIKAHKNELFVDSIHTYKIQNRRAEKDHKHIFRFCIYHPIVCSLIFYCVVQY